MCACVGVRGAGMCGEGPLLASPPWSGRGGQCPWGAGSAQRKSYRPFQCMTDRVPPSLEFVPVLPFVL